MPEAPKIEKFPFSSKNGAKRLQAGNLFLSPLYRKRMPGIKITEIARKPDKTVKFPTGVEFFTYRKNAGYYCDKFENMMKSVKKQHTISLVGAVPFRWKKIFDFHKKPHQAGERKDFPLLFYFGTEIAIFQDRGSVEIPSFFRR